MKYFVYTVQELRSNSGRDRRLWLYRVKKNRLVKVGVYTYSFESDGQNVVNAALHLGVFKETNAVRDKRGNISSSKLDWEEAGVAVFQEV